jgi:ribosomal protein S18 acetylase RimI-like enzyme
LLVAVGHDSVVGFCELAATRDLDGAPDVGEVMALYVHPDHWRRGAGEALVSAALSEAKRRQYRELTLWVLDSNAPARRFYEHVGFALDGERKVEERPTYSLHEVRYRRRTD